MLMLAAYVVEATDSKGELIHQTLMAKKMQKLDEVGEFRPFKFRIQAFTNRFAEELLARGLTENQVPHKLVRRLVILHKICRGAHFCHTGPCLPVESASHFSVQRGRKESEIKGQSCLVD